MFLLDKMELYFKEDIQVSEDYKLYPLDFSPELEFSFGVVKGDNVPNTEEGEEFDVYVVVYDKEIPVDAMLGRYKFDEVVIDVVCNNKELPAKEKIAMITWTITKMIKIGYNINNIKLDGKLLFNK